MITDDEVMRLFERADPARVDDAAAVADPAVYLAILRTRSGNVTLIDTEPAPTRPPSRHRWLVAAAAAAVAIVVGALVLVARDDSGTQIPADTTVAPDPATAAVEIARGFLDAYGAFNADRALTYLTDDAIAEMSGSAAGASTRAEFVLELALLEASGYQQTITGCEPQDDPSSGPGVRCAYDFHSIRSDEIGLGPYTDNHWDLTVRDGKIVSAANTIAFGTNGFSQQMWVPFAQWVATTYPDDIPKMYTGGQTNSRLTEESVQLWEQRSREYVQAVLTGPETYAADVGAICATQAARFGELTMPAEIGPDQAAAWRSTAAIMEQAHGELIALARPPATDTTAYTSFYGRLIRLVRIAEESAEAAAAGDSTRLAEREAEYLKILRGTSSGPTGSGLEDCLASPPG